MFPLCEMPSLQSVDRSLEGTLATVVGFFVKPERNMTAAAGRLVSWKLLCRRGGDYDSLSSSVERRYLKHKVLLHINS